MTTCRHDEGRPQWEWVGELGSELARRLRCLSCHEVIPMGESYDTPQVSWETLAIQIGLDLAAGVPPQACDDELEATGVTLDGRAAFWQGLLDSACGVCDVTIGELVRSIAAIDIRADGATHYEDEVLVYAAGSLAYRYLSDCRCAGGATGNRVYCLGCGDTFAVGAPHACVVARGNVL